MHWAMLGSSPMIKIALTNGASRKDEVKRFQIRHLLTLFSPGCDYHIKSGSDSDTAYLSVMNWKWIIDIIFSLPPQMVIVSIELRVYIILFFSVSNGINQWENKLINQLHALQKEYYTIVCFAHLFFA